MLRYVRLRHASLGVSLVLAASIPSNAEAAPKSDPAERGLDVFVHGAPNVIAGETLSLDLKTYGFPSVTLANPLPGATVVAAWDPETLGPNVSAAPSDATVTTDALGQARLDIPVPNGDARKITLLLALRHGEHTRTRKVEINRMPKNLIEVKVADSSVVPGSRVPTWVIVTDARTGRAVSGAAVDVALLEGDVERTTERVTTDASGLARSSFFIPSRSSGYPRLSIRGRLVTPGMTSTKANLIQASAPLTLREESPATPRMWVNWIERQLKPGETGHAEATVRDAAGEPIANHPLVWWVGPKGTTAPSSDEEWTKHGTRASTDGLGKIAMQAQAPRVVTSLGSDLNLVVRTEIEGQKIERRTSLAVGHPVATASLSFEGGDVIPGITQRAFLHVSDGENGVAGDFTVEADGLRAVKVTTDKHGDGELSWTVPDDIGATRSSGPCANNVAAAVFVRQAKPIEALARHPEPFELCATIDRARSSLLRTSVQVARIGDKIHTSVQPSKRSARGAGSVVVKSPEGFGPTFWTKDNGEADIDLAVATPGIHDVTLAVPRPNKEAETTSTRILLVPKVLPKVTAKIAGGRMAPGGIAEVDVTLTDEKGAPITGAVTAVTIDKEGGGWVDGLLNADARISLCDAAAAPRDRCDAFLLDTDPSSEMLRRSTMLGTSSSRSQPPVFDPAAHTTEALEKTFSAVLHSLEGAIFQSETPESLRDVRRKDKNAWTFNPELMTLVTAAMSEAPTTPGGEPFGLQDLIAVDSQVSFDNVARRVTRLKLFNVLAAFRTFRHDAQLDAEEPILRDPNAILRTLVRQDKLKQEQLLDPWGGTIQFVKTNETPVPFMHVQGFALHAPGPDGRVGTADDVKDPFERVVRAGSPYAKAMGEDEIVDARLDMRVSDSTVDNWRDMFARLTGTELGSSGTGSGQGFGSGHGRLGGSHTTKSPSIRMGSTMVTETAQWTEPVRTDAQGRARIKIPLGDYETTWRTAFLARTDAGQSAVSLLDIPAFLPVSARVDMGKKLTVGDALSARIVVRNRTSSAKSMTLDVAGEGSLAIDPKQNRVLSVDVPANAVRSVFARFLTKSEGKGKITVTLRAPGTDGDRSTMETDVEPAGEPRVIATSAWISGKSGLRVELPAGYTLRGSARLVLESGVEDALLAALSAVEPEAGMSPEELADSLEVAARIQKVAESQGKHWLVSRTRHVSELALAHLKEQGDTAAPRTRAALDRARLFESAAQKTDGAASTATKSALPRRGGSEDATCPKDADLESAPIATFLDAEPPPGPNGPLPCFTALMSKVSLTPAPASSEGKTAAFTIAPAPPSPLDLARSAMALFDRPHRTPLAMTLGEQLAKTTRTDLLGEPAFEGKRSDRVIVLAALARSAAMPSAWAKSPATQRRLVEAMLALRDVRGGFGSSEATRDAVRTLVALEGNQVRRARVTVHDGESKHVVDVGAAGSPSIVLGQETTRVDIDVAGNAILARLERPALRSFLGTPDTTITPVAVSADWPNDAKAGSTGVVHINYKLALGRNVGVWTRLPLPPGVELAASVKDVVQRQGVVHIRTTVNGAQTISLPVRFTLPGRVLVPEAETRTTSEEQPRTLTPARTLVVR